MDDPIGCWQVFLDDVVLSAGVVHQDEPLKQPHRDKLISVFMSTSVLLRQLCDYLNIVEMKSQV